MTLREGPDHEKTPEKTGLKGIIRGIVDWVSKSMQKAQLDPEDVHGAELMKSMRTAGLPEDIIEEVIERRVREFALIERKRLKE